ncbi:unnamed protein product [Eretmochelys imbricata]
MAELHESHTKRIRVNRSIFGSQIWTGISSCMYSARCANGPVPACCRPWKWVQRIHSSFAEKDKQMFLVTVMQAQDGQRFACVHTQNLIPLVKPTLSGSLDNSSANILLPAKYHSGCCLTCACKTVLQPQSSNALVPATITAPVIILNSIA